MRVLLMALSVGILAAMQAWGAVEDEFRPSAQIVYKTIGDVALQLHMFQPEGWNANDKRPALVFFFGGGWTGGTPQQFYPQSAHYAELGLVAFSAEYRVHSRHGTTPFECVEDGKSAVRYVRAHAAELGIDPQRIVAGGGSAGGHVAACTGIIEGLETSEDTAVSSKPNALMLFNPAVDTVSLERRASRFGGRAEELSPVHHVKAGAPPTVIFHGTADETVAFADVQRFCELMKAAGNRCDLVPFEGASHGFFNYKRSRTAFDATLREGDAFLKSLGYLSGLTREPDQQGTP